jgi:serine/threonine protein kinase
MGADGPVLLPEAAPPPQAVGTELAPGYRIIGHLNRGNRLDVYDAWSVERDSRCVLKTLRPDRAPEPAARRALVREGRLLRRFSHPHLVRAYELTAAIDDGRPVVVLETLDGETLSHLVHRLLEQGRRLPLTEVAVLGVQLGSVLAYLHHHGWLHLDLKPSNIVASGGQARLIDLSIARRPGRARAGTGTFEYLSPEQARGGLLTAAADVWGLGAVLYAVLAGEPPYGYGDDAADDDTHEGDDAYDDSDAVYPQLLGEPLPVRRHRRIPGELATIVDACLEREPTRRPTLPDVAAGLDAWLVAQLGHGVRA